MVSLRIQSRLPRSSAGASGEALRTKLEYRVSDILPQSAPHCKAKRILRYPPGIVIIYKKYGIVFDKTPVLRYSMAWNYFLDRRRSFYAISQTSRTDVRSFYYRSVSLRLRRLTGCLYLFIPRQGLRQRPDRQHRADGRQAVCGQVGRWAFLWPSSSASSSSGCSGSTGVSWWCCSRS